MQITDTPTGPWQKISMDFVRKLPITSEGNKFIMTIQDNFSKFAILAPLKSQNAESTADALINNAILKFGCPEYCFSDRGTNFTSKLQKNCLKSMRIKQLLTTTFRPQCNGSLERFHRPLKDFLKSFVNDAQTIGINYAKRYVDQAKRLNSIPSSSVRKRMCNAFACKISS